MTLLTPEEIERLEKMTAEERAAAFEAAVQAEVQALRDNEAARKAEFAEARRRRVASDHHERNGGGEGRARPRHARQGHEQLRPCRRAGPG